jgi:lysozyme
MTTEYLAIDVETEEGRVKTAYPDPLSPLGKACTARAISLKDYRLVPGYAALSGRPWTVGVGFTGDNIGPSTGMTDVQIDAELGNRLGAIESTFDRAIPWWRNLSDERQDVLVQMAYQMGTDGLLGFHDTLTALQAGDYKAAAEHMRNSAWCKRQTPARALRESHQIETGLRAWA